VVGAVQGCLLVVVIRVWDEVIGFPQQRGERYAHLMSIPPDQLIVRSQMLSALAMLEECVTLCPDSHWDEKVGVYPFWQVVYHTLCFVDCYLTSDNDAFAREVGARSAWTINPQPKGMLEFEEEYPSRRFTRDEMVWYVGFCREKITRVIGGESAEVLAGASGFSWLKFSRAELHVYNLRHLAHHTGQLTASLRRGGVETKWVKAMPLR